MEEYLSKVVQLFSYLTDKDLFAEIYRNQLAKRLLNQRSASDDMERLMIGKLKLSIRSIVVRLFKLSFLLREVSMGVLVVTIFYCSFQFLREIYVVRD